MLSGISFGEDISMLMSVSEKVDSGTAVPSSKICKRPIWLECFELSSGVLEEVSQAVNRRQGSSIQKVIAHLFLDSILLPDYQIIIRPMGECGELL